MPLLSLTRSCGTGYVICSTSTSRTSRSMTPLHVKWFYHRATPTCVFLPLCRVCILNAIYSVERHRRARISTCSLATYSPKAHARSPIDRFPDHLHLHLQLYYDDHCYTVPPSLASWSRSLLAIVPAPFIYFPAKARCGVAFSTQCLMHRVGSLCLRAISGLLLREWVLIGARARTRAIRTQSLSCIGVLSD